MTSAAGITRAGMLVTYPFVRREVAHLQLLHGLEVAPFGELHVVQASVQGPVPTVACVVGNDGVRSPREKPKRAVSLPVARGQGEDLDGRT